MSAQSVIRLCEQFVRDQKFSDVTLGYLQQTLALANAPIIQLQYEMALFAGLDHDQACQRALPVLIQNCAIHLADDIADGDCDYLQLPQAATALYTLQQLVALSIQHCELENSETFFRRLALVGDAQHEEIDCTTWTLNKAKQAAEGLNGQQFQAYFYLASAGSSMQFQMEALGYAYGIVNHLANDLMSRDERIMSLSVDAQNDLRRWGLDYAQQIIDAQIPVLTTRLSPLLKHLR